MHTLPSRTDRSLDAEADRARQGDRVEGRATPEPDHQLREPSPRADGAAAGDHRPVGHLGLGDQVGIAVHAREPSPAEDGSPELEGAERLARTRERDRDSRSALQRRHAAHRTRHAIKGAVAGARDAQQGTDVASANAPAYRPGGRGVDVARSANEGGERHVSARTTSGPAHEEREPAIPGHAGGQEPVHLGRRQHAATEAEAYEQRGAVHRLPDSVMFADDEIDVLRRDDVTGHRVELDACPLVRRVLIGTPGHVLDQRNIDAAEVLVAKLALEVCLDQAHGRLHVDPLVRLRRSEVERRVLGRQHPVEPDAHVDILRHASAEALLHALCVRLALLPRGRNGGTRAAEALIERLDVLPAFTGGQLEGVNAGVARRGLPEGRSRRHEDGEEGHEGREHAAHAISHAGLCRQLICFAPQQGVVERSIVNRISLGPTSTVNEGGVIHWTPDRRKYGFCKVHPSQQLFAAFEGLANVSFFAFFVNRKAPLEPGASLRGGDEATRPGSNGVFCADLKSSVFFCQLGRK